MINLGIISDINTKQRVGAVGIDLDTGDVAYFAGNEDLEYVLDLLVQDELDLHVIERSDEIIVEHTASITTKNGEYMALLSYELPSPWCITEARAIDEELDKVLEDVYVQLFDNEGDSDE